MKKQEILIGILAALLVALFSKFIVGCGIEPDKEIVLVEAEKPPIAEPPLCEGNPISSTRVLACPAGEEGQIVEVCRTDGKWWPANNTCKTSCEKASLSWAGGIQEIIVKNCVECHGGYQKYEVVKNLALTGLGSAGGVSKLEYYITLPDSDERSMPKNRTNLPPDDIESIKAWIGGGAPESGNCGVDSSKVNLNDLESAALDLIANIPEDEDKANYQFFTMAHKYNQGLDLKGEYEALNRALNSISFANDIYLCKPVDAKGTLCVVDISALKITKDAVKRIQDFDQVNLVSDTTKGKILRALTANEQPIIHHDVFIDTVYNNPELYYEIMGFLNFKQVLRKFGINFDRAVLANDYKLIGTNESDISAGRNTRLIAIFSGEINGFDTACHVSWDNPALDGAQFDLFQSPFLVGPFVIEGDKFVTDKVFNFTASEIICGNPNRTHSYALVNNAGELQNAAPENIVFCNRPNCIDPTITNGIDCMNCHSDGYIPKLDVIRNHVVGSRDFNEVEVDLAKLIYQDNVRNAATFNLHNNWYRKAMTEIGRVEGSTDTFTEGHNVYLGRQTLEQVAAFVFSDPDYIKKCIAESQTLVKLLGGLIADEPAKVTHDTLIQALPDLLKQCRLVQDALIYQ